VAGKINPYSGFQPQIKKEKIVIIYTTGMTEHKRSYSEELFFFCPYNESQWGPFCSAFRDLFQNIFFCVLQKKSKSYRFGMT